MSGRNSFDTLSPEITFEELAGGPIERSHRSLSGLTMEDLSHGEMDLLFQTQQRLEQMGRDRIREREATGREPENYWTIIDALIQYENLMNDGGPLSSAKEFMAYLDAFRAEIEIETYGMTDF